MRYFVRFKDIDSPFAMQTPVPGESEESFADKYVTMCREDLQPHQGIDKTIFIAWPISNDAFYSLKILKNDRMIRA